MLFSIVSVSAVCLALAISGWVPPDPQFSDVIFTGLVTFGQLWYREERHVTASSADSVVTWLGSFLSPMTDQNFEDICSCRSAQDHGGSSLWPSYRTPPMTEVGTGVIRGTIGRLTADITYGVAFAMSSLQNTVILADSIANDLDKADNFLLATWWMTGTLPVIHIRDITLREILYTPHFSSCPVSWTLILPVLIMIFRRGKNKRVNRHYVYSRRCAEGSGQ